MVPFIIGSLGTAATLYSFMQGTESVCKSIDDYVDKNMDIWTDFPVLGYEFSVIKLRSKSERRRVHSYNILLCEIISKYLNTEFTEDYLNKKWTEEELRLMFRLGSACEEWWASGFVGQYLSEIPEIDPKAMVIFKTLNTQEKSTIASAQSLILDREAQSI